MNNVINNGPLNLLVLVVLCFTISYASGIHEKQPYIWVHYVLTGVFAVVISIRAKRMRHAGIISFMSPVSRWIIAGLLLSYIVSPFVGGIGCFTAVHVTLWHVFMFIIMRELFRNSEYAHDRYASIIAAFVICAALDLMAGVYVKYFGSIALWGVEISQPALGGYARLVGWSISPNRAGPFFLYGTIGLYQLAHVYSAKRTGKYFVLLKTILIMGILMTGSRTAIIATMAFLLVYLLYSHVRVRYIVLLLSVLAVLYGMLTALGHERCESFLELFMDTSRLQKTLVYFEDGKLYIESRDDVFDLALSAWKSGTFMEKVLGQGPGAVGILTGRAAHSGFLNALVCQGLVGLFLLLGFLASMIHQSWRMVVLTAREPRLRGPFQIQLAYWISYAILNVACNVFGFANEGNMFLLMMLAQFNMLCHQRRKYSMS